MAIPTKGRITTFLAAVSLLAVVTLLYGPFITSPPFFDDANFFDNPRPTVVNPTWRNIFDTRPVAWSAFAFTYRFWGLEPAAYRAGNLIFHFLTAFSLFLFLRDLLRQARSDNAALAAFAAAMLFAVHPVAAFAAGYIIQQSIILAGLFSLWMWIAVHHGVTSGRKSWLLFSALMYFLAIYSKEHAVTALPVACLVAWNAANGDLRKTTSALVLPLSLWTVTAIFIVLHMRGTFGAIYEPNAGGMIAADSLPTDHLLLRSGLNQGFLFFKYLAFWLVPNENWMAIDLRVPFPPAWFAWPWLPGFIAFCACPLIVVFAVWRGLMSRLVGIGLISPWLLFLPMFAAVLYQEPFVLYRSYLWALPGTLLAAVMLVKLARKYQIILLIVLGFILFALSFSRLQIFSEPVALWTESIKRLDGKDELPGAYRSYQQRGVAYAQRWEERQTQQDMLLALADFSRAVQLSPGDPKSYDNRGQAYLALGDYANALDDFDYALRLNSAFALARFHRGVTLLESGRQEEGLTVLSYTCATYRIGCEYANPRANRRAR